VTIETVSDCVSTLNFEGPKAGEIDMGAG